MNIARTLNVVDCHAEGEVGKVVVGGIGDVPGHSMFEKRVYLEEHLDQLRGLLIFEPRGAAVQNANIVLPSHHPDAQFGYVILESEEYPAMSGSNTMCVATVLLETGMVPMQEPVTQLTLESPAGIISVECECRDGKVLSARLTNQPAFVYHQQQPLEIPGIGTVTVDISYGGMTYVVIDAEDVGFSLVPSEARALCELGQRVKQAGAEQFEVSHPENPAIPGITQTVFCGPLDYRDGPDGRRELHSKNAVVVSPGRIDRSPCGTGTSARMASLHQRGQLDVGERFVHESLIGTKFDSRIEQTATVGSYRAVVPSVAGRSWITGINTLTLDPSDPFPNGYKLGDMWGTS